MKNILIATALILTTHLTTAQTIYVDADATEWLGDGLSWQTAFANLHEALAAATDGDEVWIAEGTYYPSSTDNPFEFFEVPAGVSIYGGFKGDELIRSQRDWSKYPTIISGEIGTGAHSDNSNNLLSVMGENVGINGLVLQESYFDPTASSTYASSAIYVGISGSVVVNNCRFFDCVSRSGTAIKGGAYSSITMNNCLVENNIINEGNMVTSDIDGSVTIRHCTFTQNTKYSTTSPAGLVGGNSSGNYDVFNCILWDNDGMQTGSGTITLDQCLLDFGPSGNALEVYLNNEISDPLFNDPSNGDFTLSSASPAIDFGTSNYNVTNRDLAHVQREINSSPDAGCYEFYNPTTIFVDLDANGANTGTSWANAFNDLNDALDAALYGDEIWVAEGIYKPTDGTNRYVSFNVNFGLKIYGGFAGTETQRNQRDWTAHTTTLSGAIGIANDVSDNSLTIVTIIGFDNIIDGFTIRSAYHDVNIGGQYYGAVRYDDYAECSIRHSIFRNNEANQQAAISSNINTTIRLRDCLFRDNSIGNSSLVYANVGGFLQAVNCTFAQNDFFNGFGNLVGGPESSKAIVVDKCIVAENPGASSAVGEHCVGTRNIFDIDANNDIAYELADPLFNNPSDNDFSLTANSPAIDNGSYSIDNTSLTDLIGNPRIWNEFSDAGCYEFRPSGVIFVDGDATGANDGSSWTNAYTELTDAVENFNGSDEIWVAEGTYFPSSTGDRWERFELPLNAEIYGGFNGEEFERVQRDPQNNETVISGEVGISYFNRSYRLFEVIDCGDVVVDGFTISYTWADGLVDSEQGAVAFIENSSVTFSQCEISNHHAEGDFGCFYVDGLSSLTLEQCEVKYNSTSGVGGVVGVLEGGSCSFISTNFDVNSSTGMGSVVFSYGDLFMEDCLIKNSTTTSEFGGAVVSYEGQVIANRCVFESNSAATGAAITISSDNNHTIFNCEFLENTSTGVLGTVVFSNGHITMENCLFAGNTSQGSTALHLGELASANVVNSTFTQNMPGDSPLSTTTLFFAGSGEMANCIVWGNLAEDQVLIDGTGWSVSNCIVEGGASGTSNLDLDPKFIDPENQNFSFNANSPAYNAGNDVYHFQNIDLQGSTRIADGTIDMGCYEQQQCDVPHDLCTNAIILETNGNWQFGTNRCANNGSDGGTLCRPSVGRTVWYAFSAPLSGAVSIQLSSVNGIDGDFDPQLVVIEGSCAEQNEIICSDLEGAGGDEQLDLGGLNPGAMYGIRVDGIGPEQGTWMVRVVETILACPGDFNSDGTVDTIDLLYFLSQFGCASGCDADLTGDDTVNTNDLLAFLSLFGTDC